VALRKLFIIEW